MAILIQQRLHLPVRLVMTIHAHTTPEAGHVVYRAMSSVSLSGVSCRTLRRSSILLILLLYIVP